METNIHALTYIHISLDLSAEVYCPENCNTVNSLTTSLLKQSINKLSHIHLFYIK